MQHDLELWVPAFFVDLDLDLDPDTDLDCDSDPETGLDLDLHCDVDAMVCQRHQECFQDVSCGKGSI